jgi:DNA (cytosine-5)-methyltransferase 1
MPRALDLFSGAGGASMGLHRAGFEVTGVDLHPQKHHPFRFIQADALEFDLSGYDLIWASPVCKRFSSATRTAGTAENWPDQIAAIRRRLVEWGGPYIIENVPGAPLINPIMLCGTMFGLRVTRHRLFETNFYLLAPPHAAHGEPVVKMGRKPAPGQLINPVGKFIGADYAREAMDTRWMTGREISQAIPPAYAEWLGRAALSQMVAAAA